MDLPLDQQNIINILGIQSLPDERKAALVDKMSILIQKRLLVRILDSLSESKREEFEKILVQNNEENLNDFISQNIPDLEQLTAEEVKQLKQELAGLAQKED